jgi:glycosyltransferase involved in cell wall biosynthesis
LNEEPSTLPNTTIVMPTWNRFKLEKRAISSVLKQTAQNWELLISDSSSTSELENWIEELQDERIRYLHSPHIWPEYKRRNMSELARGKFIAFLDSDDYWHYDWLAHHITPFNLWHGLGLVWDYAVNINESYRISPKVVQPLRPGLHQKTELAKKLMTYNFVHMSSFLMKTDVLREIGGFPANPLCDWDIAIMSSIKHPTFLLGETLTFCQVDSPGRMSDLLWVKRFTQRRQLTNLIRHPFMSAESWKARLHYFLTHGRKARFTSKWAELHLENEIARSVIALNRSRACEKDGL